LLEVEGLGISGNVSRPEGTLFSLVELLG
jgi:hypothetical protein